MSAFDPAFLRRVAACIRETNYGPEGTLHAETEANRLDAKADQIEALGPPNSCTFCDVLHETGLGHPPTPTPVKEEKPGDFTAMNHKFATDRFGFPDMNGWGRQASVTASDGTKWDWNGSGLWRRLPSATTHSISEVEADAEWQTWQEVPEGVKYRETPRRQMFGQWWWVNRNGIRHLADICGEEVATEIVNPVGPFLPVAPFVAAKEKS